MKVFIDPGHRCPPEDRGALGILAEEDVAIAVAEALGQTLVERGITVKFSNAKDGSTVTASLSERCRQSNRFDPDLFVSIHCNAHRATEDPMGIEVFAASTKGGAFATKVEANIAKLGFKSRGVKDGSHLFVIRNTQAPAILVELFFIDSRADCDLYKKVRATALALAIADAIAPTPLPPTAMKETSPPGNDIRSGYLVDAAKYFSGQPHQIEAWTQLQSQVPIAALSRFQSVYSPRQVAATESIRPDLDLDNIDWSNPNCRISKYFKVVEVTKGDSRRTPKVGSVEEKNILFLASELDKLREAFGSPLGVTSWYRPAAINKAVGGVPDSQHINGLAVDVYPLNGSSIYEFQKWCESVWYGALGRGANKGFVHLDTRNGKGYLSGGEKGPRWEY